MTDEPIMPPPAPPPDTPPAIPVQFSAEEINFFLAVLDFYKPEIVRLTEIIPPAELAVVLGFLQAPWRLKCRS